MGRAGRVKPGGYVEFTWPENETRPVQIMHVESVARIVALREYPERSAPSRVMLCDLADLHCEQEKRHIVNVSLNAGKKLRALQIRVLRLKHSAILVKAISYDIGFETAAILAEKQAGRTARRGEFTMKSLCTQ